MTSRTISSTWLDQGIRQFNPRTGGRLDIDHKLAGIRARKIGFADDRVEPRLSTKMPVMPSTVASGRSNARVRDP